MIPWLGIPPHEHCPGEDEVEAEEMHPPPWFEDERDGQRESAEP